MKPPDIHIKQPPPPPPWPARFPGSPKHSDKLPCSASQRYENTSACSGPSSPSSAISTYLTPVSPAHSQESPNVTGTNYGTQISPPPLPLNPPPLQSSRRGSTYSEIDSQYLEILPDNQDETDLSGLLNWFKRMLSYSGSIPLSLYGAGKEDMRSISQKAMNATKAWHLYNLLMMKHKEDLQKIITDFRSICEHLNKTKKKHKAIGIAGGTTSAVGGGAIVVGIALAPVTFGASLVVSAVGAGMIVSAGGIGALAAIASKKTVTRAAVEKLVNDYKEGVTDLEHCLDFILSMVMELQRHGIARLESAGAHPDAVRMAYKLHNVLSGMDIYARSGGMTSVKLLQAFTKEMDLFFTEKNGQKLKKSNKSIFSGKVSLLADGLKEGLYHLTEIWEKLS
ncbi:uncharacterized protein LOC115784451 [Archocentrus centrarchus]|uniref:uncharacterized protein LOC115784451 n=1 Tax=Archocentrus centrarchus TaxID=63155 RepID=UPI0011E9B38B|nr:uncharacterized protein LOC115784451 [Archocentrus centrarchus]